MNMWSLTAVSTDEIIMYNVLSARHILTRFPYCTCRKQVILLHCVIFCINGNAIMKKIIHPFCLAISQNTYILSPPLSLSLCLFLTLLSSYLPFSLYSPSLPQLSLSLTLPPSLSLPPHPPTLYPSPLSRFFLLPFFSLANFWPSF